MALIPLKSKSTSARSVPLSCTCTTWAFAALKDLLNMLSETTIQNPWTWLTLLRLPPRLTSRNPSDSHSTRCRKVPQTVLSIGAPDFVQTKKCPSESPFCLLRQLQVRLVLQVLPSIPGSKRNTHTHTQKVATGDWTFPIHTTADCYAEGTNTSASRALRRQNT